MGSLHDYWDLFVLVEAAAFRSGLESLLHPTWMAHLYVGIILAFVVFYVSRQVLDHNRQVDGVV